MRRSMMGLVFHVEHGVAWRGVAGLIAVQQNWLGANPPAQYPPIQSWSPAALPYSKQRSNNPQNPQILGFKKQV